jgi:hypothetical protein
MEVIDLSVSPQQYPSQEEEYPIGFQGWSTHEKAEHLKQLCEKYPVYKNILKEALKSSIKDKLNEAIRILETL